MRQSSRNLFPGSVRGCHTAVLLFALLPGTLSGQWTGGPSGPIYYNSGNVGIGTPSPGIKLDVVSPEIEQIYARNSTVGSRYLYMGVYTTGYARVGTWNPAGGGGFPLVLQDSGGNVGIGTTNPGNYKLAVEGTIGARDIIVTSLPWSDYVFRPGYRLRPLTEVSAFIQKHHHLPEIPTESEVREKGVSLGDMQAKLLAKVEELTLHLIQQEKQNKELRERVAQLENRISANSGVASGR